MVHLCISAVDVCCADTFSSSVSKPRPWLPENYIVWASSLAWESACKWAGEFPAQPPSWAGNFLFLFSLPSYFCTINSLEQGMCVILWIHVIAARHYCNAYYKYLEDDVAFLRTTVFYFLASIFFPMIFFPFVYSVIAFSEWEQNLTFFMKHTMKMWKL